LRALSLLHEARALTTGYFNRPLQDVAFFEALSHEYVVQYFEVITVLTQGWVALKVQ